MKNIFKLTIYILACITVFFFIAVEYERSRQEIENDYTYLNNKASAFEWNKTVSVFFGNSNIESKTDCRDNFPVQRRVINAETLGPGALEALINGVTPEEKAQGYYSYINPYSLVQKFEIIDKVAYVDFDKTFNQGVAGSCNVLGIRSQIERTLNSLPDIDSVIISVDGETEGILEP